MTRRHWELPILGVVLLVILLPLVFNPFIAQPFESSKVVCLRLLTATILVATLLQSGSDWRTRLQRIVSRWRIVATPLVFFLLSYCLATAASIDVSLSLWGPGNLHGAITMAFVVALFLLLLSTIESWGQIERITNAIIFGSVPVALYGWIQYLGLDALAWQTASISPVHSTLGRSVFLGAYLVMVIPFTLARMVKTMENGRSRRFVALLGILALQLGCLLFTLARGAWLGFLAATLLFVGLAFDWRRLPWRRIFALAVAVLVIFIVIAQFGGALFPEEAGVASGDYFRFIRDTSNNVRLTTWRDATTLIPDRWLVGYGPETYAKSVAAAGLIDIASPDAWMHQDDPHNIWLGHLTAVGVLGLAAFIWFVIRFYRVTFSALAKAAGRENRVLLAAVLSSTVAYFIHAQLNPDVITITVFFWIALALGFAAANVSERGRLGSA